MWTINNCSIVSTTPTFRQHSVAGATTICRIDKTKFIFDNKNLRAERWKQWRSTRRSSVSCNLLLLSGRLSNTASENQADQVRRWHCHIHIRTSGGWPNQWPQRLSVAWAQQQKTDSLYFFSCLFQCSLLSSEIYEYLFIIVCLNTGIKHWLIDGKTDSVNGRIYSNTFHAR